MRRMDRDQAAPTDAATDVATDAATGRPASTGTDASPEHTDELLVEEISIDGMCGVY